MGDLTKNISRSEVACKCGCGQDAIDFQVVQAVQWACDYWTLKLGVPKVVCHITSANRCAHHNRTIGAKNSQHVLGKAIDFRIDGVSHRNLYDSLNKQYNDRYGLACYDWGVHIDSRTEKARW